MSQITYEPVGYRILVEFVPVEESYGIIAKPKQTVKSEQNAQVRAKLIAMGPESFTTYEAHHRPEVGDMLLVAKYGGFEIPGDENKNLRIYNDEDVAAIERSV
jgi:co-chaperonin GroES (HSP10)